MSIEAMSVVLGLSMGKGNGSRKLILLGYANHADKFGCDAYPSKRILADYSECDERTVQRHIRWLIAHGYLREGDQRSARHIEPRYRPIVYDVAMSGSQVQDWAAAAQRASAVQGKAVEAGGLGGPTSAHVSRGDNLSPVDDQASLQVSRGDRLSPLGGGSRGDTGHVSGETNHAARGDAGVSQTVLEPSSKPSSSSRAPAAAAGATALARQGGGTTEQMLADALDLLPESVRDHPSVIPSAIEKKTRTLDERGWPRAEVRARMAGVETADTPGAAALARLAALEDLHPPSPPPPRPHWCGHCDQRTRLREDEEHDGRPYRCPGCHPRTVTAGPPALIRAKVATTYPRAEQSANS